MDYEIVKVEKKYVAGLKIRTTNENWKCIGDMGALWQDFFGKNIPGMLNNKKGNYSYGIYNNYESDLTKPYDYTAAVEVHNPGSGLEEIIVPDGSYAKFSGKGNLQQIVGELWKKVWASDIKRSYTCDFELYHNDSQDMDNQTVDLYISVIRQ